MLRCKNRFRTTDENSEYRVIMLNLLFEHDGRQQAVELQLALEVLQALKHFMHKPYEVIRCNDLSEFCLSKHVFMDKADASSQEFRERRADMGLKLKIKE